MAVFNQVDVVVRDMEASAAFYRLLGVDVMGPRDRSKQYVPDPA